MAKPSLAIAAVAVVAMMAPMIAPAAAQGPSYESRGYGGPLYVGPNFQGGGQHAPPVYDSNSSKRTKKKVYREAKPHKERAKPSETARSTPAKGGGDDDNENSSISRVGKEEAPGAGSSGTAAVQSENSSISAAELSTGTAPRAAETEARRVVGCKKYFPTAGMTLSVPCE